MRELDECKAEIFCRSEKRIRERQKRRRILTMVPLCIPLCISLFMITAVLSIGLLPAGNGGYDGTIEMTPDNHYKGEIPNIPGNAGDHYGSAGNVPGGSNGSSGGIPIAPGDSSGSNDGIPVAPGSASFGTVDSFSFSLTWGCYGISSYDSETGKLVKTTDATNPEDYITTYQLTDAQKQQIYDLVKGLNVTAYPDTYDPHANGFVSKPSMTLILSVETDEVRKTITAADIALTFKSENSQGQKFLNVCKAIRDILQETEEWKALPEYEHFYD